MAMDNKTLADIDKNQPMKNPTTKTLTTNDNLTIPVVANLTNVVVVTIQVIVDQYLQCLLLLILRDIQ